MEANPKTFISSAHDTEQFADKVLADISKIDLLRTFILSNLDKLEHRCSGLLAIC